MADAGKEETSTFVPVGVKIIAVLLYIGAGLSALLSVIGIGALLLGSLPLTTKWTLLVTLLIVLTIVNFFLGRGLWSLHNGARLIVIVLNVIGVFFDLFSLATGDTGVFTSIFISALIAGYLLFSEEVKTAFGVEHTLW